LLRSHRLQPMLQRQRAQCSPRASRPHPPPLLNLQASPSVFADIGRTTEGLFVWRIRAFELEAVPRVEFGTFYAGDSYLVYACDKVKGRCAGRGVATNAAAILHAARVTGTPRTRMRRQGRKLRRPALCTLTPLRFE
jgi:hypothetical protein